MSRTDRAMRFIAAQPQTIYAALTDPKAMAVWRPPQGMSGEILDFDPSPGGRLRMVLRYDDADQEGKSGGNSDIFDSRFVELVPGERVVEAVVFESEDAAFAGVMTITTSLLLVSGGTEVTIACADVPPGIGEADHLAGLASTLDNLARYCVERA